MACTTQTKNFRLEAANIYFGKEDITCITPDGTLTGGEYFKISTPTVKYVVWTKVNLTGSDPVLAGYTAVEVTVGAAYTVADWITAFKTALEATDNFLVTASTDGLSCKAENLDIGTVLEATVDVDTSFVFANLQLGFGGSLGKTKEGIEVTFETTLFDVLSNQNGETLEDQIIQGNKATLSASLLDITEENLRAVISKSLGDELTPSAGTVGIGYGTSKNFQSTFGYAGKLILHPVRLVPTDRTKDFVFWKSIPLADSISYDGTDTQAISVSFNALVDEAKDTAINLCMFGDWRQDFR